MLVHNAGRIARVVGEYNAGGRQILSAPLAAAAAAGDAAAAAAGVQWQLLGHGARGWADARRGASPRSVQRMRVRVRMPRRVWARGAG